MPLRAAASLSAVTVTLSVDCWAKADVEKRAVAAALKSKRERNMGYSEMG
jgi:hypothetical protein